MNGTENSDSCRIDVMSSMARRYLLDTRVHLLVLLIVTVATYGTSLRNGFVWDDTIYTVDNRIYADFDLTRIFFSFGNRVEYLPVRDLSYAVDYWIWGTNAFGFHLTNLLLFCVIITLLYFLVNALPFSVQNPKLTVATAFFTSLVFAVHPLLSEAVNFITCRNVLLSAVGFHAAALIFLRYLVSDSRAFSVGLAFGIPACYLVALLSKATSIILPPVLLLLAFIVPSNKTVRQKLLLLLPLFVIAFVFFLFFRGVGLRSGIINTSAPVSLAEKIAIALQIPFFYLKMFLFPAGLSAEYAADHLSPVLAGSAPILSLVGLVALAAVAVVMRQHFPLVLFAFLWYAITLIPVMNFFNTYPVVADRYAFLPAFALALIVGSLLANLAARHPKPTAVVVIAMVSVLGGLSMARTRDWHSDVTLWTANIRTAPGNAKGYLNLIVEAIASGNAPLAHSLLAEGRANAPSNTYNYLEGRLYYHLGDFRKALELFHLAVQRDSNDIRSLLALGIVYQDLGDNGRAAEYYRKTVAAEAIDGWGCREQAQMNLDRMAK